jgi:transposase
LVGAYCPQDHGITVRGYETVSAESILHFFKELEKKYPDATAIYVILDNARYHHANIVADYLVTSRIKLMWLPPYSPNLNLIERLWKMFKKNVLYNKYYPTFEDFQNASKKYFSQRSNLFKSQLASLLTEHFQLFPVSA